MTHEEDRIEQMTEALEKHYRLIDFLVGQVGLLSEGMDALWAQVVGLGGTPFEEHPELVKGLDALIRHIDEDL